jgi:hypothetical protein
LPSLSLWVPVGTDSCERTCGKFLFLCFIFLFISFHLLFAPPWSTHSLPVTNPSHSRATEKYAEMTSRLLDDTQKEVAQLERAWLIDEADLKYVHRIDTATPGAFGEVWLAEWDERKVAVKKLRQRARDMDEGVIEEFESEVRFMRTLRHRNIVFFYGAGVTGSMPFLVCEYLSRGSLRGILRDSGSGEGLALETRLGFVRDTAKGMRFLHTLDPPRIHRDLKR